MMPQDLESEAVMTMTGTTVQVEFEDVDLAVVAVLTGIPLVELSIQYETHIVRGSE